MSHPPRPGPAAPGQVVIAPSILSADFSDLGAEVRRLVRAGCRWVHLDVMDNHFVPNLSFGPPVIAAIRKSAPRAYFDAHLMVTDPLSLLDALVAGGVQNLTVHEEACGSGLRDTLRTIKSAGLHAGVSIKPKTPVSAIESLLPVLDIVLVMTVDPGFGGQPLIGSCLNKVRSLRRERDRKKHKYLIQVDGGINKDTAHLAAAAGADVMVAGSAVFNGGNIRKNIADLLTAAAG